MDWKYGRDLPIFRDFEVPRRDETEALDLRDRDETQALDPRDRDETETLKNSVSRPRHVSRHYSSAVYAYARIQKNFMFGYFLFNQSKKLYCPRAEDRTFSRTCRLRGQGQRLELLGQGQGLQNVSSRAPLLPIKIWKWKLSTDWLIDPYSSSTHEEAMMAIWFWRIPHPLRGCLIPSFPVDVN